MLYKATEDFYAPDIDSKVGIIKSIHKQNGSSLKKSYEIFKRLDRGETVELDIPMNIAKHYDIVPVNESEREIRESLIKEVNGQCRKEVIISLLESLENVSK